MMTQTNRGYYFKDIQDEAIKATDINLLKIKNYKEHFFLNDGLNNVSYDLDFSIYKKYRCFAGCEICYLKNDWISKEDFNKTAVVKAPDAQRVEKLLSIFSYFDLVSIIDDLFYLKTTHPDLFEFYQTHQHLFNLSSMTDNSIARHRKIIEDGFRPNAISEISVSDFYMQKTGFDTIAKNIEAIHKHVPIKKIKHLLFSKCVSNENSKSLIKWANSMGITIEKQLEFSDQVSDLVDEFKNKDIQLKDSRFEESTTYTEEFGEIYPVNNETLFLMNDSFYTELKSATSKDRNNSFQHVDDFSPVSFLSAVLSEKKRIYQLYVERIKNQESVAYKYFDYISENLNINPDFNFIPGFMLKPYTTYYKKLVEKNIMIETQYGLVSPDFNSQPKVTPIVTFKGP